MTAESCFKKIFGFLCKKIIAFVNFDGIRFHEGVLWTVNDWFTAGLILIETKDPVISVNFSKSISQ